MSLPQQEKAERGVTCNSGRPPGRRGVWRKVWRLRSFIDTSIQVCAAVVREISFAQLELELLEPVPRPVGLAAREIRGSTERTVAICGPPRLVLLLLQVTLSLTGIWATRRRIGLHSEKTAVLPCISLINRETWSIFFCFLESAKTLVKLETLQKRKMH